MHLNYNKISLTDKLSGNIVLLYALIILIGTTSCASLPKNYLGKPKKQNLFASISNEQIAAREAQRKTLTLGLDSLLQDITSHKIHNNHLLAKDLNRLYYNFGIQIDNDRFFNHLLHKGNLRRDSITSIQKYAGTKLLLAAAEYEKQYQDDKIFRRALNAGDKANNIPRNLVRKSRNFLYSSSVRKRLNKCRDNGEYDSDSLLAQLPKTNFLKASFYRIYQKNDRLHSALHSTFSFLGKTFFSAKPNKIIRRSQCENAQKLLSQLQPGDIILSQSDGFLTNQVIPGYFTHASIWLGINNHRKFPVNAEKFTQNPKKAITISDRAMAESTTTIGVHTSSLIDFSHAQTYLILRYKKLAPEQKKLVQDNIFRQMKKGYDFNFDIESSDVINCTELIFLAYDFINWETHYFMGKYTIFPDDILQTAVHTQKFEIIALLKNGELISSPDSKLIETLTNE